MVTKSSTPLHVVFDTKLVQKPTLPLPSTPRPLSILKHSRSDSWSLSSQFADGCHSSSMSSSASSSQVSTPGTNSPIEPSSSSVLSWAPQSSSLPSTTDFGITDINAQGEQQQQDAVKQLHHHQRQPSSGSNVRIRWIDEQV